jgi:hypothetical protein
MVKTYNKVVRINICIQMSKPNYFKSKNLTKYKEYVFTFMRLDNAEYIYILLLMHNLVDLETIIH